jgi:hypothetical protein
MHEQKLTDLDYINFLLAAPRVVSGTEAAQVQPDGPDRAAHDAVTRLLQRLEPDTGPLWQEAEPLPGYPQLPQITTWLFYQGGLWPGK